MYQKDRIYTSKGINDLFTLWGLLTYCYVAMGLSALNIFDRPKIFLTHFYSEEDIKVFHWRMVKMYLYTLVLSMVTT